MKLMNIGRSLPQWVQGPAKRIIRRSPTLVRLIKGGAGDGNGFSPSSLPGLGLAEKPLRFPDLTPLGVFATPARPSLRINVVTDSVSPGSLYGGVGTALVISALLARRLGADLRIVTRTERADLAHARAVLSAYGIPWDKSLDSALSLRGSGLGTVPITPQDLFLTTSWWTTRATLASVPRSRVAYILQEDERAFYPLGDDHLLCTETLTDQSLFYLVNTHLLNEYLQQEGIAPGAVAFEPAFPQGLYHPDFDAPRQGLRKFFFYARPYNARNLYWRGLEALCGAIEEGILKADEWEFVFAGHGTASPSLPFGAKVTVPGPLSLPDYAALLRQTDLALSLMYTPHPSYPPLDLAASGAVVVTNTFPPKRSLDAYSKNIICSGLGVPDLIASLRRGLALADDRATRTSQWEAGGIERDWSISTTTALDQLVGWANAPSRGA